MAKAHLEKLIATHLGDYVREYDSSSLSIGIWEGDVRLRNLVLKPQVVDIDEDSSFKIEHGFIGELRLQVPWTRLQSGHVKASVDDVHIVLKPSVEYSPENLKARENKLHEAKMAKLDKEEQQLFGMAPTSPDTWTDRIMNSLASSVLSNIVNGFSLSLSRVKVSFLLPLPAHDELCHVRLSVMSAVVEPCNSGISQQKGEIHLLGKRLSASGISVDVNRVFDSEASDHFSRDPSAPPVATHSRSLHSSLATAALSNVLVLPAQLTATLFVCERGNEGGVVSSHLTAEVGFGPVEITPHVPHMYLLRDALDQYTRDNFRRRYLHLRPIQNPSSELKNVKAWWLYTISAVLICRRGRCSLSMQELKSGKNEISTASRTQSRIRSRYIHLYRQHIENKLRAFASPLKPSAKQCRSGDEHKEQTNNNMDERWKLPPQEAAEMDALHRSTTYEKLLIYRAMVHQGLQRAGFTAEKLRASVQHSRTRSSTLGMFASHFSSESTGAMGATVDGTFVLPESRNLTHCNIDDIDAEILNLFETVNRQAQEARQHNELILNIKLFAPRVAICPRESVASHMEHSAGKVASAVSPKSAAFVLYGLQGSFAQGELSCDGTAVLSLGGLRMHGMEGVELMSCGENTDVWTHPLTSSEDNRKPALLLTYKWRMADAVGDEDACSSPSDSDEEVNTMRNAIEKMSYGHNQHKSIDFSMKTLKIVWDESSMVYLMHLAQEYSERGQTHLAPALALVTSVHPYTDIRRRCALYSKNKSYFTAVESNASSVTSWSAKMCVESVVAAFPYERSSGDSDATDVDSTSRQGVLSISSGSFKLYAGDFLVEMGMLVIPEFNDSHQAGCDSLGDIPTRSLWPHADEILKTKLSKLCTPVIRPIVVHLENVNISIVSNHIGGSSSPIQLLKAPFCCKGIVSPCLVQCHAIYPDVQIDVFCSPILLNITPKDALDIIDVTASVTHLFMSHSLSPASSCDSSGNYISQNTRFSPRIRTLAPLCVLKARIDIDEVSVTLLSPDNIRIEAAVTEILTSYSCHVRDRSGFSRTVHTAERLSIQQLGKYDIGFRAAESALRGVCNAVESHESDIDGAIRKQVLSLTKTLPSTVARIPIVSVTLHGIHISDYSLTYDCRKALYVEELLIADHECCPVIHIFCDNQGRYDNMSAHSKVKASNRERKRSNASSRKSSRPFIETIAKKLESTSISSYCAIGIVYTEQDTSCGWGAGGHSTRVLYELWPERHTPLKSGEFVVSLKNVDTLLSLSGIPQIIKSAIPIAAQLLERISSYQPGDRHGALPSSHAMGSFGSDKNYDYRRGFRKTSSYDSESMLETTNISSPKPVNSVKCSYQILVDCLHVVCADGPRYLAELAVTTMKANYSSSPQDKSVRGGKKVARKISPSLRVAISTLDLYDLSLAGSKHPTVISKSVTTDEHMIVVSVNFEKKGCNMKCFFNGMRLCILYRFVSELLSFWITHFSKHVIDELNKFEDTMQKMKRSDDVLPHADNDTLDSFDSSSEGSVERINDGDEVLTGFFEYPNVGLDASELALLNSQTKHRASLFGLDYIMADPRDVTITRTRSVDVNDVDGPSEPTRSLKYKISWSMEFTDVTLIFPRNSACDDLAAANIGRLSICEYQLSHSWDAPPPDVEMSDSDEAIYYDFDENQWMKTGHYSKCSDKPSTRPQLSPFILNHKTSFDGHHVSGRKQLFKYSTEHKGSDISSIASFESSGSVVDEEEFLSADEGDDVDTNDPAKKSIFLSRQESIDIDEDDFKDTFEEPQRPVMASVLSSQFSSRPTPRNYTECSDGDAFSEESCDENSDNVGAESVYRLVFKFENVQFFCSLASRLDVDRPPVDHMQTMFRRFTHIRQNYPVYSIVHARKGGATWSKQSWNTISLSPTNISVAVDLTETAMRFLISETERATPMRLSVSMAELYMLLSIYFDNLNEKEDFFSPDTHRGSGSVESVDTDEFVSADRPFFPQHPEYGSSAFCEYVRNIKSTVDFLVVRSDLNLRCSMDESKYFGSEIPSFKYLNIVEENDARDKYTGAKYEFANIRLQWFTLLCCMSDDVMQVALGVGDASIVDKRNPDRSFSTEVLRTSPKIVGSDLSNSINVRHGYADLDFGLREGPSSIYCPIDIPLKITYFSTGNTWGVTNIGANAPDVDVKNLDIVWLLVDYFSSYFCSAVFGSPSCAAYFMMDSNAWPYGGLDTRVFVARPHIQTVDNTVDKYCQTLVIEADKGVYFRYIYDTMHSVKMEVHVSGLAAMLLKSYRPPSQARGLRGTAGSGRGVRTLIENLSVKFSTHFDKKANVVDYLAHMYPETSAVNRSSPSYQNEHISPTTSNDDKSDAAHKQSNPSYTNFDADCLFLSGVRIPYPKCVSRLHVPTGDFPKQCCRIISSIEDIMFAVALGIEFLGLEESVEYTSSNSKLKKSDSATERKTGVVEPVIFAIFRIQNVKCMVVDNVLGLHLPLAQLFLADISAIINIAPCDDSLTPIPVKSSNNTSAADLSKELSQWTANLPLHQRKSFRLSKLPSEDSILPEPPLHRVMSIDESRTHMTKSEKLKSDIKAYGEAFMWGDYFNSMLKCWEPLVEPFTLTCLHDQSSDRGLGAIVKSTSPIHVNISVAMIRTLNDAMRVVEELGIDRRVEYQQHDDGHSREDERLSAQPDLPPSRRRASSDGTVSNLRDGAFAQHPSPQREDRVYMVGSCDDEDANYGSVFSPPSLRRSLFSRPSLAKPHLLGFQNHRRTRDSVSAVASHFTNGIEHVETVPLNKSARVGFSILNLTGYPIRYVQEWEDGNRQTIQYLQDEQRGLLNFIASNTIIRDNRIVEQSFTMDAGKSTTLKHTTGHQVALQVAGYKWIPALQSDTLGIKFEDLTSISGRIDLKSLYSKSSSMKNAIKLVAEVRPHNGGRLLKLSSAFVFKNATKHTIKLLASIENPTKMKGNILDVPYMLHPGKSFHVPISLLYRSVLQGKKVKADRDGEEVPTALGFIQLSPADKHIIVEDLGVTSQTVGGAQYAEPVDLMKTVIRTEELLNEAIARENFDGVIVHDGIYQLACELNGQSGKSSQREQRDSASAFDSHLDEIEVAKSTRIVHYDKLPQFCYNIEVEASCQSKKILKAMDGDQDGAAPSRFNRFFGSQKAREEAVSQSPCTYNIVIHPPIIIENLLPVKGTFELVHDKRAIWSSLIHPGKSRCIHTVSLNEPIMLVINLDFCLPSEGVLIHKPLSKTPEDRGLAETVIEGFKGLLEDSDSSLSDLSMMLTDNRDGQRLRLQIENKVGGGGHRNIVVYCPYWVVNTSQYTLRLREEGDHLRDVGRVAAISAPSTSSVETIPQGTRKRMQRRGGNENSIPLMEERVFPGRPGPLHSSRVKEIDVDSPLRNLLRELRFEQIMEMASLFNFVEPSESRLIGNQKVVAQLEDSNWSRPFTLESAGVNQVLSVDYAEMGMLELAFKVSSAPGKWAKYTKVIRFSPRFVVVNKLSRAARIIQVNGFLHEKVPIDISAGHLRPFHLPAVFGERQLAVDVQGPWMRSVAFDIDQLGSHNLLLRRTTDTSKLKHIITRGNPEYDVTIPHDEPSIPTDGVGIWFETDWSHKQIVVMRIKPGSFAATRTDVQHGDVLLAINGESVRDMSFEEAMQRLKTRDCNEDCVLTFRTVEEKMRRIRENVLNEGSNPSDDNLSQFSSVRGPLNASALVPEDEEKEIAIKVEMRAVDSSIFMIISDLDKNLRPEYRVENRSSCYTIHYRQKGIYNGRWTTLLPGLSATYIWEDPLKPHKLLFRVGKNILCPSNERLNSLALVNDHPLSFMSVGSTDSLVTQVLFDEIGYVCPIHVPGMDGKMVGLVQSEGPTKVLTISPDVKVQVIELQYGINFTNEQLLALGDLADRVRTVLTDGFNNPNSHLGKDVIQNLLLDMQDQTLKDIRLRHERCLKVLAEQYAELDIDDSTRHSIWTTNPRIDSILGPVITTQNTIIVEVIEATGLKPAVLGGTDETYCEIKIKNQNSKHSRLHEKLQSTYINDQTLDPYWVDQIFLFRVPVDPEESIRGYNIRVTVKSRSIVGLDTFLGRADIQFSCLHKEEELVGWFPLKPKSSSVQTSPESLQVSGSIKLRIQWVHSDKGLVSHIDKAIGRRKEELLAHLRRQQRVLRQTQKLNINVPEVPQKRLRVTQQHDGSSQSLLGESSLSDRRQRPTRLSLIRQSKSSVISSSANFPDCDAFSAVHRYVDYYRLVLQSPRHLLKRADTMCRRRNIIAENEVFMERVESETFRSFTHVNTTMGRVEITPIQALNLPTSRSNSSSDNPVSVRFTYGDDTQKTFSARPTAHPVWLNTENGLDKQASDPSVDPSKRYSRSLGASRSPKKTSAPRTVYDNLTAIFDIDTLNITGNIGVSVRQQAFPKHREVCSLELPIFSLLDCICTLNHGATYDRWFPLRISAECKPIEGDMGASLHPNSSEKMYSNLFEYHPCIRLLIRWHDSSEMRRDRRTSTMYCRVHVPAFSLSIIDSNRAREIMQIVISDIEGRHSDSLEFTESSLIVSWLQVDNQLPEPVSPVIVAPTSVLRPQPALRLHIKKNNILSHEHLESFEFIQLIVQELDLHLEQQTVVAVWEFIQTVMTTISTRVKDDDTNGGDHEHANRQPLHHPAAADTDIDKIYVDHFYIAPIMIKISFIMTPQALSGSNSRSVIGKTGNYGGDIPVGEQSSVNLFLWQVGEVVLDLTSTISDAPIRLNGMTVNHLFKTWNEVTSILQDHYLNTALGQMYRIVGSLDLVGNPVGLLSSLGVGVRDFFYEPAYALISSPTEIGKIGKGVVKGAVSLASNTADGLLGTATTMTRSVGKGVAVLTMDDIFLRNRDRLNKQPENAMGFVVRPVKDMANGIYCGVVGVVRVPYHGAKRHGVAGFVTGVGKGVAGVAAKPVVGVLDAITHSGDGVRYGMKVLMKRSGLPVKKRRYSNLFGPDGRLMPYSYTTAYGSHMLRLQDQLFWETSTSRARLMSLGPDNRSLKDTPENSFKRLSKRNLLAEPPTSRRGGSIMGSLLGTSVDDDSAAPASAISEQSQFSLMKARRTSLSIGHSSDMNELECVVYTAIINRSVGHDQLVVVTNVRVVVGDFKREKSGNSVTINWQCKISALKSVSLNRIQGCTSTLTLIASVISKSAIRRQDAASEASISLSGDYDVLRELHNCLKTIKYNFDSIIPLYEGDDTWEEDEHNIISIGPWQYLRRQVNDEDEYDNDAIVAKIKRRKLMEALEVCPWVINPDPQNETGGDIATWLQDDRENVIQAHSKIKEYMDKGIARMNDTPNERMCKELLRTGKANGYEFDALMATAVRGKDLHLPSSACEDSNAKQGGKAKSQGISGPNPLEVARKLRNTVRRTISRFTAPTDAESCDLPPHSPVLTHAASTGSARGLGSTKLFATLSSDSNALENSPVSGDDNDETRASRAASLPTRRFVPYTAGNGNSFEEKSDDDVPSTVLSLDERTLSNSSNKGFSIVSGYDSPDGGEARLSGSPLLSSKRISDGLRKTVARFSSQSASEPRLSPLPPNSPHPSSGSVESSVIGDPLKKRNGTEKTQHNGSTPLSIFSHVEDEQPDEQLDEVEPDSSSPGATHITRVASLPTLMEIVEHDSCDEVSDRSADGLITREESQSPPISIRSKSKEVKNDKNSRMSNGYFSVPARIRDDEYSHTNQLEDGHGDIGDVISALSNVTGDSTRMVEVMDRLGRMENLLTSIIQRSSVSADIKSRVLAEAEKEEDIEGVNGRG